MEQCIFMAVLNMMKLLIVVLFKSFLHTFFQVLLFPLFNLGFHLSTPAYLVTVLQINFITLNQFNEHDGMGGAVAPAIHWISI